MTATKDFQAPLVGGATTEYTLKAATTIYAGSFVAIDTAAGTAVAATDAASRVCVGICQKYADYATAGDRVVQVVSEGVFLVKATGLAATDVGAMAYVYQDDTVTVAGGVSNSVQVGIIVKYVSATSCWVRMKLPNLQAQTAASVSIADAGSIITGTNTETALQEVFNNLGGSTSRVLKVYEFWYDFATHTGAQGAITLTKRGGAVAQALPDNFVPISVYGEVELAMTSGGAATVTAGLAAVADAILGSLAFNHASLAINKMFAGTAATSILKTTAATDVTFTISTADLTAGRINFYFVGFQGA